MVRDLTVTNPVLIEFSHCEKLPLLRQFFAFPQLALLSFWANNA